MGRESDPEEQGGQIFLSFDLSVVFGEANFFPSSFSAQEVGEDGACAPRGRGGRVEQAEWDDEKSRAEGHPALAEGGEWPSAVF